MKELYPLHKALLKRDKVSAEIYISNPSSEKWCREKYYGYTPLAIACRYDLDERLILQILAKEPRAAAIPTCKDRGDYPIHLCAKFGSMSSAVIDALLIEYPYAVEEKSYSNIGILMTPIQLSRGNRGLPSESKSKLLRPIEHWISLNEYMSNASEHSKIMERQQSLESNDILDTNEQNLMMKDVLGKVESALVDSKKSEANLVSKINRLESKFEQLSVLSKQNSSRRRLSLTNVLNRSKGGMEYLRESVAISRRNSASRYRARRRSSLMSQGRNNYANTN